MKKYALTALAALLAASATVQADPWKDESGNGNRDYHYDNHKRSYKTEYRDGRCKVEKKWEGNGEYKEERKCKGYDYDHRDRRHDYDGGEPAIVITTPDIVIKP
ncbi:TPA: hypothetical protein ACOQZT_000386 [Serratia odorifera]|uniref:hypothetical protein n=1 Tax=Serratia odorifera TaxID=618 RepID=UPI003B65E76B